jgi:hypothetical protein
MSVLPEMGDDESERKYRQDPKDKETFLDACLRHAARLAPSAGHSVRPGRLGVEPFVSLGGSAVRCADARVLVEGPVAAGAASGCS